VLIRIATLPAQNFIWADTFPQHRRRGIFVDYIRKSSSSPVGAAYSDDVAPTELGNISGSRATKILHLRRWEAAKDRVSPSHYHKFISICLLEFLWMLVLGIWILSHVLAI
jgi:hypothetical protein